MYLLLQGFIPTWSAPSPPPETRSVSGYSKEQRTQTVVTFLQRRRTQHELGCQHEIRRNYLLSEDTADNSDFLQILDNCIAPQLVLEDRHGVSYGSASYSINVQCHSFSLQTSDCQKHNISMHAVVQYFFGEETQVQRSCDVAEAS